jgi:hypothetical protein
VKTSNIKEEKEYEGHAHASHKTTTSSSAMRIFVFARTLVWLALLCTSARRDCQINNHVSRSSCELSVHKRAVCLRVVRALPSGGVVKANVTHAQRKSEGSRISRGEIFLRSIY